MFCIQEGWLAHYVLYPGWAVTCFCPKREWVGYYMFCIQVGGQLPSDVSPNSHPSNKTIDGQHAFQINTLIDGAPILPGYV